MPNTVAYTAAPHASLRGRRLQSAAYWVVSLPVLLETAVGIQWDLARIPYVIDTRWPDSAFLPT